MNTLRDLWLSFAKHPEGQWVIGYQDAKRLYDIVKKIKPAKVLDLGTGIGAGVATVAFAMRELQAQDTSYKPLIKTYEQFEKCFKLAQELIPKGLQELIRFFLAPARITHFDEVPYQPFSVYSPFEIEDFDLVIIDGPGPWPEGDRLIDFPNGDILKLLYCLKPGTVIYLDQRRAAESLYLRYLQPYMGVLHREVDYTVFVRTEKPYRLDLVDSKLEEMKAIHYTDKVVQPSSGSTPVLPLK